jgi:hypothetical protein
MHPLLVLAPVVVFGRAAAIRNSARALPRLAVLALAVTGALAVYRAGLPYAEAMAGRPVGTGYLPYAALARDMAARGYDHGTALTADVREAGNLRAVLPDLRVVAYINSHRLLRPPHTDRSRERCFVIWRIGEPPGRSGPELAPPYFPREGLQPLGDIPMILDIGTGRRGRHDRVRWAIQDLVPQSAACR